MTVPAAEGMSHAVAAYLNPQPVPPRTMAATSTAPAMEPIMILVPLGPVTEGTGGEGTGTRISGDTHMVTEPQGSPSAIGTWEGDKTQLCRGTRGDSDTGPPGGGWGQSGTPPACGDRGQQGHGEPLPSPWSTRTLVSLRLPRRLGLGDGVIDAAVLPCPLGPADALALVAANLRRDGVTPPKCRDTSPGPLCPSPCPSPRGQSRSSRPSCRGRS